MATGTRRRSRCGVRCASLCGGLCRGVFRHLPRGRLTGYNFASARPSASTPSARRTPRTKILCLPPTSRGAAARAPRRRPARCPRATQHHPLGSLVLAYRSSADTRRKDDAINLALLTALHPTVARRDGHTSATAPTMRRREFSARPRQLPFNLLLMVSSPNRPNVPSIPDRPVLPLNPGTDRESPTRSLPAADNHTFEIALHATGVYQLRGLGRCQVLNPCRSPRRVAASPSHSALHRACVSSRRPFTRALTRLHLPLMSTASATFGTLVKGRVPEGYRALPARRSRQRPEPTCRENLGSSPSNATATSSAVPSTDALQQLPASPPARYPRPRPLRGRTRRPADFLPVVTARLTQFRGGDGRLRSATPPCAPAPLVEPPANVRANGRSAKCRHKSPSTSTAPSRRRLMQDLPTSTSSS